MENRSSTLSLLDEIKDIATREAATETLKPAEPSASAAAQAPRRATSSLNLELSKALADIHETVSRDAEREESRRQQTLELERAAKEAQERARDAEQARELELRVRVESARQQAADEERRLKVLRLDYEAALARGEQVEMPMELRPKPVPQVVIDLQAAEAPRPLAVAPPKRSPVALWGGVAAFVAVAAAAAFFYNARVEAERLERERIEAERVAELRRVQAERAAAEAKLQEELRVAREAVEAAKRAQLEASLAAARAEEERKRAEEESKKKAKRPGKKRDAKKPAIKGINFTGF